MWQVPHRTTLAFVFREKKPQDTLKMENDPFLYLLVGTNLFWDISNFQHMMFAVVFSFIYEFSHVLRNNQSAYWSGLASTSILIFIYG